MAATTVDRPRIEPQPGPQTKFLTSSADIAIYGGSAGGGKTYALLLESLRNVGNPDFGAVIFRRVSTQITGQGGLWDTSKSLFPALSGEPSTQPRYHWRFPSGAKVSFAHLQYEQDVLGWQGSQIPLIAFDELTHFTQWQFFYMLSRNRSTCGVRPYVRATTNPDAGSWAAQLVSWWIDEKTGFPIAERSGVLRYFTRLGDEMVWGDSPDEVVEKAARTGISGTAREMVKSITFIPSTLDDNAILMRQDPSYRANLLALPRVERERLLGGNWKVKPTGGSFFPQSAAPVLQAVPADVLHWVRRWDLAATPVSEQNRSPDATAGVLLGKRLDGSYVVADLVHLRETASKVRQAVLNTAAQDKARFGRVLTVIPQDPAQAGKDQAASYVAMLAGHTVKTVREDKGKQARAEPFAAQWQVGNVALVAGSWNGVFISEMDGFPDADHDDIPDAASGAFAELSAPAGTSKAAKFRAMT